LQEKFGAADRGRTGDVKLGKLAAVAPMAITFVSIMFPLQLDSTITTIRFWIISSVFVAFFLVQLTEQDGQCFS